MINSDKAKKDKQKNFRMTPEVSDKFDKYYAEEKGDSALTQDEIFERMLETCLEHRFDNKYPGRRDEINSFVDNLDRIKEQYRASLAMYDSAKANTEQKFKAELEKRAKEISDLVTELTHLKESIQKKEEIIANLTEENTKLNDRVAQLEADLEAKDSVIKSNAENNELAKTLTTLVKEMKNQEVKPKKKDNV